MGAGAGLRDPLPPPAPFCTPSRPPAWGRGRAAPGPASPRAHPATPRGGGGWARLSSSPSSPPLLTTPRRPPQGPRGREGHTAGRVHPALLAPAQRLPRNSSRGPTASQLRTEERDRQGPQPLTCTTHGSSLAAMVTSAQVACPYPTQTGIRGPSSQPQRCWGLVGGGSSLLCLLGFHISASQNSVMGASLHVSSPAQASRTEMPAPPPPDPRPVGGGPLLRRKQMGAQGHFIPLEIHLDRAPLPWCSPGCRGCHQGCACP